MRKNLLIGVSAILLLIPVVIAAENCPSRVDMVFVVDTSGSMNNEWITLCDIMESIIDQLDDMGTSVDYAIYGLKEPRDCTTDFITMEICPADFNHGDREQWGQGVKWVAENYNWRQNTQRIIFVISDEGPYCGGDGDDPNDRLDADDMEVLYNAIEAANDNSVTVFGLWGDGSSNGVINLMKEISGDTGGEAHYFGDADSVTFIILDAICGCIIPTFMTSPQKSSGELFEASWSRTFMNTPFLEDMKNCWGWTKSGEGTLYDGSGFERYDICKSACDAKKDCDALDEGSLKCNSAFREGTSTLCGGSGSHECSHCIADSPTPHCVEDDHDCTVVKDTCTQLDGTEILGEQYASGGPCYKTWVPKSPEDPTLVEIVVCPASVKEEDCFNVCKIEPLGYKLEADVDGSFYDIPYDWDSCPKGFDGKQEIEIYPHTWGDWDDPAPGSYTIEKCVLIGGVLGITTFTISDTTGIDDGVKPSIDNNNMEISHLISHPAFRLNETGNMKFEITYAGLSRSGTKYTITRLYKPEDTDRKFIVNSDLAFNYTLLDVADELRIDAEHEYITMLRRDIHYVACDETVCSKEKCVLDESCSCDYGGCDWHVSKEPTYKDTYEGCGNPNKPSIDRYSHCWYSCECSYDDEGECTGCSCDYDEEVKVRKRIEIETELINDVMTLNQQIVIPKVSHKDILDNTQIKITGIIDQFVDEEGNREISGELNITLDPDILSMFVLQVNDSTINYFPTIYPVKHYLYKKFASPGEETKIYTHEDSYGYEREEFDFIEQCRSICPTDPVCRCPVDNPLDPECLDLEKGEYVPTEECACLPNECYPNPCLSKRNFHEEQGIRIRNGEFEKDLGEEYKNWAKIEGDVTWPVNGFSGYGVKLENGGCIKQRIAPIPMHTFPYNELCFMYGIEECKSDGYLKLYVNENEKFRLECNDHAPKYCGLPSGWNRQCVEITEREISSVEFKSKNVKVYIDNVNLGDYYDFVALYTSNLSSETKYFDLGFIDYDYAGSLTTSDNIRQTSEDHRTTYTLDFNILKISYINPVTGEEEIYTPTANDIREYANITIHSHFRNITIDLFPPKLTGNPEVNVILRAPTRIYYEFDKKPYMIKPGEEVHGKLRLYYYDTNDPLDNEKIYIKSESGIAEFLSPDSLINDGYVTTDASGEAGFSFKIRGTDKLIFSFLGHMGHSPPASPTTAEVQVGSTEFRSPFFQGEFLASFLILILILIFILFSYRFFRRRRIDFEEWLKTLKGEE